MNLLTRITTFVDRGHYTWIGEDIASLQETCTALRGIGMGGSVAFADLATTIDVHRGEQCRIAARLRAAGLKPHEYAMTKLEAAAWAVWGAALAAWVLVLLFGR